MYRYNALNSDENSLSNSPKLLDNRVKGKKG
jgi:hypothetical protein